MSTAVISPVLNRKQAAEFLGVAEQTLAVWASTRRYRLPFIRVGRRAMYRIADLEKFLTERTVDTGVANQ
jgi:predicted site-specific integrase-resolvase